MCLISKQRPSVQWDYLAYLNSLLKMTGTYLPLCRVIAVVNSNSDTIKELGTLSETNVIKRVLTLNSVLLADHFERREDYTYINIVGHRYVGAISMKVTTIILRKYSLMIYSTY